MNFDLNMLSTLMQLMGKQPKSEPPRGTEPPAQTGQRVATSSFVLENGIGEKVRLDADNSAPSSSNANPLAGILELMGGGSGGADGMSALMPMLMGLLGKGDQGAKKSSATAENKAHPSNDVFQNVRGGYDDICKPTESTHSGQQDPTHTHDKNIPGNVRARAQQGMFAPISYAGYSLISALNLLCRHVYG